MRISSLFFVAAIIAISSAVMPSAHAESYTNGAYGETLRLALDDAVVDVTVSNIRAAHDVKRRPIIVAEVTLRGVSGRWRYRANQWIYGEAQAASGAILTATDVPPLPAGPEAPDKAVTGAVVWYAMPYPSGTVKLRDEGVMIAGWG